MISDLHLGYERALEEEGLYLPRMNTDSIKESLHKAIDRYSPEKVVILGDIKHDFRRAESECRREVLEVLELIEETSEPILIKGNHDNYLQNIVSHKPYEVLDHLDIGGYRLEHGHNDSGSRPVIIGHEHPSLRMFDGIGAHVKLPCFLWSPGRILVLPSFSRLPSGNDIGVDGESFMSPALKDIGYGDIEGFAVSEIGLLPLGLLADIQPFIF